MHQIYRMSTSRVFLKEKNRRKNAPALSGKYGYVPIAILPWEQPLPLHAVRGIPFPPE